jgi:hypothetical protein
MTTANNDGKGWGSAQSGGIVINLNYEIARTALATFESTYNDDRYPNSPQVSSRLIAARNILQQASQAQGAQRSVSGTFVEKY